MKNLLAGLAESIAKNIRQNRRGIIVGLMSSLGMIVNPVQALTININPGAALSANPAALAAFNNAARQWSSRISDPITVNIDADLASLSPGVIGSASSVLLYGGYNTIRGRMIADSASEPDDGIVAALPTAAEFSGLLPTGFEFDGAISATKANLKALGWNGLDQRFGASDGTINFSTNFDFDFDSSDGTTPGHIDFETVAAHEIGHALGFVSVVDLIDAVIDLGTTVPVAPRPLDLFRFAADSNPSDLKEFTEFPRNLVPGEPALFDDLETELALSSGVAHGDGRQASHWKDNGLTDDLLGVMDPTLAFGGAFRVSEYDLRALDLIGYDISSVPLPGALPMFSFALVGLIAVLGNHRQEFV